VFFVLNRPKPGASSMVGLFQEHGPCRIKNDSSGVDLNPTSWNEVANMCALYFCRLFNSIDKLRRLYIDQPVGVGFSYGDAVVGTSEDAAKDVWKVNEDHCYSLSFY
jgi:carboxypeptidase C (cathepsin A)